MRYKPDRKQETHQRILETASREFRKNGFESSGIAKLMQKLDMTHGAFYAHFQDKDHLVRESVDFALQENLELLMDLLKKKGLEGFLDFYLSTGHLEHPELGCPLPSLTAEIAREEIEPRQQFTAGLRTTLNAVAEYLPGASSQERRSNASFLFSAIVGAVALARAVSDTAQQQEILVSARRNLLARFHADPK